MLVVDLQTKTAKLSQTINSSDYNYLSKVVTEQSQDIDALETAIGDINSLLDDINGEVI